MAITIQDSPINYSPVYSPNLYIVDEPTLTSEDNFKYIAEIYDGGTKIAELKAIPHPTKNWGRFDISEVIQNYVNEVINFDLDVYTSKEILKSIKVDFGWEYINSSGVYTRVTANATDTNLYFNGSPSYSEFVELRSNPAQHPYLITNASDVWDKYPLTSRRNVETVRGTKQWLTYMPEVYTYVDKLEVDDLDGPIINNIQIPVGLKNSTDGKAYSFRVDPEAIEAQTTFTGLENYRVRTKNTISGATSSWINFTVKPCTRFTPYSLYYLNRWGGIDSLSVNGRSSTTVEVEREVYINDSRPVSDSGVVDYSSENHTRKTFHTKQRNVLQLTSDWISYEMKESAKDLQTSPIVWLEDDNGLILPVNVINEDFVIVDKNDTEPIMVNMTVEYVEQNNRQKV